MIAMVTYYIVRPGAEGEAIEYIHELQEHTRGESGCRLYFAHQSPTNPRRFLFYEKYEDRTALDAHRATPYFTKYVTNGLATISENRATELFAPMGE